MEIKVFPNGIYGATTYLVWDKKSHEAVLIDATSSVNEIQKIVHHEKLNLKYILITHGHFDHVYCISEFKEKFPQAQALIHKDDLVLLNQVPVQCQMMDLPEITVPCIDGLMDEKSHNLKIGDKEIKVIHTKGHSKGGVCYLIENVLFSGDTLFRDSVGRCDLYGGDFNEIGDSIKNKLFILPENTIVYPGHGEETSIGYEKKYNPYFWMGE